MHGRWVNAVVVMLWLATMSWLMTEKVLPPLIIGEPPSYSRIVDAQRSSPPVGWRVAMGGREFGWALGEAYLHPSGLTAIHGWVHFDHLPLRETMPGWLCALSRLLTRPIDGIQLDSRSEVLIDPLGRLVRFDSSVQVTPFDEVITARGMVEDRQLEIAVRAGGATITNVVNLPNNALLCDALSPQSELPGLRAGQKWTVPVYSPLCPAGSPLEIVHAEVERLEPIYWNGESVNCWTVAYRGDSGSRAGKNKTPRGMLWVRRDGAVLRQQTMLFDSVLVFERMADDEAARLARSAGRQWWLSEGDAPKSEGP